MLPLASQTIVVEVGMYFLEWISTFGNVLQICVQCFDLAFSLMKNSLRLYWALL